MSRIADAFGAVRAEKDLKDRTLERVMGHARAKGRPAAGGAGLRLAAACCSVAVVFLVGGWVYLTPTAAISLEVNPAVELGINRFDRVVSARGLNEDGEELLKQVDVWGASYDEAVERLLGSDWVSGVLDDGGAADVIVVELEAGDAGQCERLLAGVEACSAGTEGVRCHAGGAGHGAEHGAGAGGGVSTDAGEGSAGEGGGAGEGSGAGHGHRHGHHE